MESFHINFLAFLHLLLLSLSLFSGHFLINCSALGQCVEAESTSLLQLKQGFSYFLFNTWIPGTNCCNWEGVTCDEWSRVISLDLSNQGLDGTINPSLFNLTSLRTLNFATNSFFGNSIPDSGWDRLGNLSSLDLSYCGFVGKVPVGIAHLKKLTVINLSSNYIPLNNSLSFTIKPTLLQNMRSLKELYLDNVDLSTYWSEWSGAFVNSTMILEVLSMRGSSLFGGFPKPIFQLRNLKQLDISENPMLYGSLPDFSVDNNLIRLVLYHTNFSGNLPNTIGNLKFLKDLDLSSCQFSGIIPSSIGNLSQLETLNLSNNSKLQGPIPRSLFQLSKLSNLYLASNNFSEVMVELEQIKGLVSLKKLDLSNSGFSLGSWEADHGSSLSSYPNISLLALASCNLTKIPTFIKYQPQISFLDLSNNKIYGEIPSLIWNIVQLNLSCNMFTHVTMHHINLSDFHPIRVIDLHSNIIEGSIPPLPFIEPVFMDFSNNRLTSFISFNTTPNLNYLKFLSLANNNLTGEIPQFICNMTQLQMLDLSNNSLIGSILPCLLRDGIDLQVLNLRGNLLHGTIPDEFSPKCELQILNFRDNQLEGLLPRSLSNCQSLELMDLGNNNLKDTFPYWLGNMSSMRVLVLRYNKFYGLVGPLDENYETNYTFSTLHILDISSNNFSGNLCAECFSNFRSMMTNRADTQNDVTFIILHPISYMVLLTIMNKGQQMIIQKIWTIVKSIDFSNNFFEGEIPPTIGQLTSLQVLNMSHNYLTGIGIFAFLGLFKPLIQQVNRKNSSWRSILHFPQHVF
ncbi:receptor-like protein 7 isoform X1 [Dendrobium catenatum]|uniref:receptor-like protein 7 isoform X1 n=1 Tax=Dendrobium catenatum TaxID=906689 RepID=UPI0009F1FB2C|nr:receptor-like protein 7 isoform X1 [Dendrobium catenatum]